MTAITDKITEVLREHAVTFASVLMIECRCGWFGLGHRSHVAEAIAPAIEPEIRADECRKAADEVENAADVLYLRYRADQYEKERP